MSKKYTKEELEVLSLEELYDLSGLSIQTVNDVNPIETRTLVDMYPDSDDVSWQTI